MGVGLRQGASRHTYQHKQSCCLSQSEEGERLVLIPSLRHIRLLLYLLSLIFLYFSFIACHRKGLGG